MEKNHTKNIGLGFALLFFANACGGGGSDDDPYTGEPVPELPAPTCSAVDGDEVVESPVLTTTLADSWQEAWLGSVAVADLDGDGSNEILAPRSNLVLGWNKDGDVVYRVETEGRIWAPPVVADLDPDLEGLEVAVSSRDKIYAWDKDGNSLSGYPVTWRDEMRSLAAGDIDGDGLLELVAVTTNGLSSGSFTDIIIAFDRRGNQVGGFPPNTTGASGCSENCWVTGGFDQNVALGDVNGDGNLDVFASQDNAYMSLHAGDGRAFDAASIFAVDSFLGLRMLHDYDLAQQGWANDEGSANQAHGTNSAPAIADIDGDGNGEIVMVASVQNADQSDRLRGVALWVINSDGTRPSGWEEPFHASDYLAGLWDFEGDNIVGATNQVSVADFNQETAGYEFVFAGFDGKIHAVDSFKSELWTYTYTASDRVLTGGVAVADLSGDGAPEVVFASYSPDEGQSHLFVLNALGSQLHKITLPGRGAMAVPTIADVDGDETLEILVNLKDSQDGTKQVQIYNVPGSSSNCLLWPTGRGNLRRNGYIP